MCRLLFCLSFVSCLRVHDSNNQLYLTDLSRDIVFHNYSYRIIISFHCILYAILFLDMSCPESDRDDARTLSKYIYSHLITQTIISSTRTLILRTVPFLFSFIS